MNKKLILNFLKWQLKNRIPGGGFFERAFTNTKGISENSLEYYMYLCDLYEQSLLKYVFGSYMINEEQVDKFFEFMDEEFRDENDCYKFTLNDGSEFQLPIPSLNDRKIYRTELFDLVLPYLCGYPERSLPFHEGPYEYGNVKLSKNDIVMDLGANFGMFSAYASAKGCEVYAFEPTVETLDTYLRKTVELNPNIICTDLAVSNSDGFQEFIIDKKDNRCNGIAMTKTNLLNHAEEKIFVPTTTVDCFVSSNNLKKVDFIKADIEGAERLMLSGAKEVLKEFEPNLSICYYHLLDDYKVLRELILDANPNYVIEKKWKKIYAYTKKSFKV